MNQSENARLYDHPDAAARRAMLNEMHRRQLIVNGAPTLYAKNAVRDGRSSEQPSVAKLELV